MILQDRLAQIFLCKLVRGKQLPSFLDDGMIFQRTPPGTSIRAGSKLLSVRHKDINSKDDLKLVRCTGKRLWARIADPSTSKRKVSKGSSIFIQFWIAWCLRPQMPVSLAVPAMDFQYKLAADAFAKGEDIGIGGWVQLPNQPCIWFSERFKVHEFLALGLPMQTNANLDITSYENIGPTGTGRLFFFVYSSWQTASANC